MTDRLVTGLVWCRCCEGGACMEVAASEDGERVLIRTTKDPGTIVDLSRDEWNGFLAGVKQGAFDQVV